MAKTSQADRAAHRPYLDDLADLYDRFIRVMDSLRPLHTSNGPPKQSRAYMVDERTARRWPGPRSWLR
jgi:hypothetical protein